VSRRDHIVLDAFGGSGTTLIAAEKTGRKARLLELDPTYCDVICRRFEACTGTSAILAESSLPWAEVADIRAETAPAGAVS
jgi:DNA modification methylase